MTTKHEAIAVALTNLIVSDVFVGATREDELPHECPEEGVVNLTFAAPRELGRQLGVGIREISRIANIEIVVTGTSQQARIATMETILFDIGAALSDAEAHQSIGVDYIDIGEPIEPEVIPMAGATTLRGTTVPIELLYETSNNPMEMA